jgi:hypothetical protein
MAIRLSQNPRRLVREWVRIQNIQRPLPILPENVIVVKGDST